MSRPLARIRTHLEELQASGSFAARRTAEAHDLSLEVKGVGPIRFPISPEQARALRDVARPARYGRGEETLLDRDVRDTWKVAKSRVKIDQRRWHGTLRPVLEELRADLGLPEGARLRPELHSLLLYGPGQFFHPHQDTEKGDRMVGTLVVTLPSAYRGGAFVVEHRGEKVTYRRTKRPLSFVAFYADCRHEVRPVKEGHRVALTYNLMLEADEGAWAAGMGPEEMEHLAEALAEYFETPTPPRWSRGKPGESPPDRFVFLLDHEYTERGLAWERLKGNDAVRARALRKAAMVAECEAALALAEVHEIWSAWPEEEEPWYDRRWRSWDTDPEDRLGADESYPVEDGDVYTFQDLEGRDVRLDRWIPPGTDGIEIISTHAEDHEVCAVTPSSELEPYDSEYTGFMGNWGNTMDRWYRRAAVVLWPTDRGFAVRAEASPGWALQALLERIRAGEVEAARERVRAILPFWRWGLGWDEGKGIAQRALEVAEGLDDPDLARSLLEPLRLEQIGPSAGPAFAALVRRYGEDWARERVEEWAGGGGLRREVAHGPGRTWAEALPELAAAVIDEGGEVGIRAAQLLVAEQWRGLRHALEARLGWRSPSRRREALEEGAGPLLAFLQAAERAGAGDARDEAMAFLLDEVEEARLPLLVALVQAARESVPIGEGAIPGLEAVEARVISALEERLARPARSADDWSITPPGTCDCELCGTLAGFLADPSRQEFEWPLAKEKRKHIHRVLDGHELPVLHRTRRSGRPYTLVLTKTDELFHREAAERQRWKARLERLRTRS